MNVKAITILSGDGNRVEICVVPLGNRFYRLFEDLYITLYTDEGTFRFKFKASLVYNSVRLFGKSAYEDDDKLTETNSKLFTFEWSADNG